MPHKVTASNTAQSLAEVVRGTPLYLIQESYDRSVVEQHEITHTFISAHFIPNQPRPDIQWRHITDDEAMAIVRDEFVLDPDDPKESHELGHALHEAAKQQRLRYAEDPIRALNEFTTAFQN